MSNRKAARFAVGFVVVGACAGSLAAVTAYAKWPTQTDGAVSYNDQWAEPQVSNRAAKTHRLLVAALAVPANPVYTLASADAGFVPERATDSVIASAPKIPEVVAAPPEPKATAFAPAPAPHEKPIAKRLPPPPAAPPAHSGVLDDGQISGLKGRLRLTSDQVEYWPAVEAALRDVVRTQLRGGKPGGKVNIDTNSTEVQKLIWAAVPLLMRLREDQKSEVRKLARVIGLEQVASQI